MDAAPTNAPRTGSRAGGESSQSRPRVDDGNADNADNADNCLDSCQVAACDDGVVGPGEECDGIYEIDPDKDGPRDEHVDRQS